MKFKIFVSLLGVMLMAACVSSEPEYVEPPYNYIADHVRVIDKTSNYVVYEYLNIRVDEVAPVAAIYCNDHDGKQAILYNIELRPNNRRRAVFVCK